MDNDNQTLRRQLSRGNSMPVNTGLTSGTIAAMALAIQLLAFCGQTGEPALPSPEFQKAAEAGNAGAQWLLGCVYRDSGRMDQALAWYRKSANQGFGPAQGALAFMYANGKGVPRDENEANKWAAKSREARTETDDERVAKQLIEDPALRSNALAYYRRMAETGDSFAQYFLGAAYLNGSVVAKDVKAGIAWLEKAAAQGNVNALSALGVLLKEGADGLAPDGARAAEWLRKASENGGINAAVLLASMYMRGDGVPQSNEDAFKLLTLAGEKYANPTAQALLGTFYEIGDVCKEDPKRALGLFRLAAEKDDVLGQWFLGLAYHTGKLVAKDARIAGQWLEKAAKQGHADAQGLWGFYVMSGKAGKPDYVEALKWFVRSAEGGCKKTREFLTHLADEGPVVSAEEQESVTAFWQRGTDGDADASYVLYYLGSYGTKRNLKEEERLLRLAAEKGNTKAREEMSRRGFK